MNRRILTLVCGTGLIAGCGAGATSATSTTTTVDATRNDAPINATDDAESGPGATGEESAATTGVAPGASAAGQTLQNPLKACGGSESYAMVARHRCSDGSMPLGGDPQAGAGARRGSVGSHVRTSGVDPTASHIVDLYEVPCPSGPVQVFVCLYHCPNGQNPYGR